MGKSERKALILEVVDNQIRDSDPPEARQTFERLMGEGISRDNAKIYIGQVVSVEMWDAFKNQKKFNLERYLRNLENLPDEPSEQ
jgi:hypothetical protein